MSPRGESTVARFASERLSIGGGRRFGAVALEVRSWQNDRQRYGIARFSVPLPRTEKPKTEGVTDLTFYQS
jgi:hypothetical protein